MTAITHSVSWFDVNEHQHQQRIDNFLFTRLKGVPKSHIYRLMRDGQIRVNKKRIKPGYKLQTGDQIRVAPIRMAERTSPAEISDDFADAMRQRVVFEDEGLMIINKPSGLAVHGGSGIHVGLIEAMRQAVEKPYLELIHRIDKDTSGLVMISKKRRVLKQLQDDLREHRIEKTYHALVKGQMSLDQQLIDAPLLRYELANGERRVKVSEQGKASQTRWETVQRFKNNSWIKAQPLTGRTHQIRVHGLMIGHPLLGDDKYGHQFEARDVKPKRLCLHAQQLVIPSYGRIEIEMAADMAELIQQLKQH